MARGEYNSGKGGGGFKLFGVEINLEDDIHTASSSSSVSNTVKKKRSHVGEEVECMRKSKSMGNLHEICNREENHGVAANGGDDSGYHSDDVLHVNSGRAAHGRKKGTPWTASEHRSFLLGLNKLGKGDWKGISKNYVPTRTPTQVASHAQKYFIRMTAAEKKNRRASLFDIPYEEKELHSPPHASSAASFNASEGSQQVNTTSAGDPFKKNNENRGLDGISAHIAASEKKPPLSPATRTYVPDTCHIPYMVGVPGQSFPAAHVMPHTEAYPMLNYQYASYYYVPNNGNIPAPMMTQTPNGLFLQPRPILHGPSQAHPVTPLAGNIDAVKGPTTSFTTYAAPFPIQYRTPAGPSTSTVAKKEDLETGVGALSL